MRKRIRGATIGWYLKQLLPLHYCTISRQVLGEHGEPGIGAVTDYGKPEFVRWRMFLGRCFAIQREAV